MSRKQMLKTDIQDERKRQKLLSKGQPVVREHHDKYEDEAIQSRTAQSSLERSITEYKSRIISRMSDMATIMENDGDDDGNIISMLKELRRDIRTNKLYRQLEDNEKLDMEESLCSLEDFYLASLIPLIDEQIFNHSEDIESGSYVMGWTENHPIIIEHFSRRYGRTIEAVPLDLAGNFF